METTVKTGMQFYCHPALNEIYTVGDIKNGEVYIYWTFGSNSSRKETRYTVQQAEEHIKSEAWKVI